MSLHPPPVLLLDDLSTAPTVVPVGWSARQGFELPSMPWNLAEKRLICIGTISDEATATSAMTALARGVGLIVAIEFSGSALQRFLEDLHRLGSADPLVAPDVPVLSAEQRDLLAALSGGATVTEAALALFVSRRTANRRLAEARYLLGVTTNAEAVTRWSDTAKAS